MSSIQRSYETMLQEFDRLFGQLKRQLQSREHITESLQEANAVFAAQLTQRDGRKLIDAYDQLKRVLEKTSLEPDEQLTLVLIIQVGLAMQEKVLKNRRMLTNTQRSNHRLATVALYDLCMFAVHSSITESGLWVDAYHFGMKAEKARDTAVKASGHLEYIDDTSDTEPSATPLSRATTPSASAPRSTTLKEKALAILNERPAKTAPLDRAHTMPSLSSSGSMSSHGSGSRRGPSKAHSRGNGLQVLEEEEE